MKVYNDGSHMSWDKSMVTNPNSRPPTIEECLELFDVDEWCWTCEEYADYPKYIAWAVNPATGEIRKRDKSNLLLAVQVIK